MSDTKRLFKGINCYHIAYTEPSQGGACSGYNDPIMLKSKEIDKSLSDNQKELMDEAGVDYDSALAKSKESASDESLDGGQHEADNQNVNEKEKEDNMSEETLKAMDDVQKELAEVRKELAIEKASKNLAGFGLEAELEIEVAKAVVAAGEHSEAIFKAFEALVAAKEEAVSKAVEAEAKKEVNPIARSLSEEQGSAEESEAPVAKSFAEKVKAASEAIAK